MEKRFENLLHSNENYIRHSELLDSQALTILLTELLKQSNAITDNITANVPEYIKKALGMINKNFMNHLTLETFSKELSISKYHFQKKFKHYMGISPIEYLNNIRIDKAKTLLMITNYSIAEIAIRTGFTDQNYFTKVFKKLQGETPVFFRISHQKR